MNIKEFFKGCIYLAENRLNINKQNVLVELAKAKTNDNEPWILSRGNVFLNEKAPKSTPNDIVIFDVFFDNDSYEYSFRGFLYSNGKVSGKLKRSIDAGDTNAGIFNGIYFRLNEHSIIMYGEWEDSKSKESYFIELLKNQEISNVSIKNEAKMNQIISIREEILTSTAAKSFPLLYGREFKYHHVIYINNENENEKIVLYQHSTNQRKKICQVDFQSKIQSLKGKKYSEYVYFMASFSWYDSNKKDLFACNPFEFKKFKESAILDQLLSDTNGYFVFIEDLAKLINMITGIGYSEANQMAQKHYSNKKVRNQIERLKFVDGRTIGEILSERMCQKSLRHPFLNGAYHLYNHLNS